MRNEDPMQGFIEIHRGVGPIVAVAVHDGHAVRDEVDRRFDISPAQRRREEDPYTRQWTNIASTRVIGLRSRFEVDLNRLRHRSVYRTPKDAWGLKVWRTPADSDVIDRSFGLYDAFYHSMYQLFSEIQRQHGAFFVYDLHAYNHRRHGPDGPAADPADNPQINVCTGGMDLERCEPVVDCFVEAMRDFDFPSGALDVRCNVRFRATRFSRWVHENFPGSGISIGIEVKKFFMDEWTGELFPAIHQSIGEALASTVEPIEAMLPKLNSSQDRLS